MKPYYEENGITIYCGDALEVLNILPEQSVNCCVTSPPYWGLRDYGTAKWEGGDAACDHRQIHGGEGDASSKQNTSAGSQSLQYRAICGKCGARRIDSQLGLEATPTEYVEKLVAVFREVRRVLRDDGTLWLNLGDSYNGVGRGEKANGLRMAARSTTERTVPGLKPKDLVGIPWRVSFALQADGWWLRSDIIWSKPNPMPESVTDRPTKSHEYIFLLSKCERYYYNAEAIKEPSSPDSHRRYARGRSNNHKWADGGPGNQTIAKTFEHMRIDREGPNSRIHVDRDPQHSSERKVRQPGVTPKSDSRNKRSVWTVATQPYPEAHFATFPEKLIEPCILAGCPQGGTVLDPFLGSGTTAAVSQRLNCKAIGIELNESYIQLATKRLSQSTFNFVEDLCPASTPEPSEKSR